MAPTRKIKIFVLQSVLISLLVIFVEALSVEPNYAQYGKRFICTNQNDQYVKSSACNIKLLNRTYQLNNLSVIFHPNVTLNNAYVRFFLDLFQQNYPVTILSTLFRRYISPPITNLSSSIAQWFYRYNWIYAGI